MATFKIIFRPSSVSNTEGTLYYRVIHNRKTKQIHTGHKISCGEWDTTACRIIISGDSARCRYLTKVQEELDVATDRLKYIIADYEQSSTAFTASDIVSQLMSTETTSGFISFARTLINENLRIGNISCAEHYTTAVNSIIRYAGRSEIPFAEFNCTFIKGYEQHLRQLGLCPNTTSYYMRKLRAIYNQAVERKLTVQTVPFKHVYTGIARTTKRAISIDIIRSLRTMDLSSDPQAALARDMFLFSFYTRGMAIVDMAYLEKSAIKNGVLTYRRKKTQQALSIRWELPMQEIGARYHNRHSKFVLPLINSEKGDLRRQYLNASHKINHALKRIGRQLGLNEPLTMYVARHAWASIAQDNNVPISVISQGMGHDSEKTTRIYLASLRNNVVDNANSHILSLLIANPSS